MNIVLTTKDGLTEVIDHIVIPGDRVPTEIHRRLPDETGQPKGRERVYTYRNLMFDGKPQYKETHTLL